MNWADIYVSIDFDGTITDSDITDAIIQRFARPGWEEAEKQWEQGNIGSRECLKAQFALVDAPLSSMLEYADTFSVDAGFKDYVRFLKINGIRFSIISDGFRVFIERILKNAGLSNIPVYANRLREEGGALKVDFPYASKNCLSGVCKAELAATLSSGAPIIHIGDGRSDFCISETANFVYSKGKLTDFCKSNGLPHVEFTRFNDIRSSMAAFVSSEASVNNEPIILIPAFNEIAG